MKHLVTVRLFLFVLVLTACSNSAQPTSTPVPTSTLTAVPTSSAIPEPTGTPLPPTETPATDSEWNGIPIMPGAVAGDGDEESYVFAIQATLQQVREYYELEMGKLGWQSSVEGDGTNSLMLTFTKDASETLTVNVLAKGDEVLVLLLK